MPAVVQPKAFVSGFDIDIPQLWTSLPEIERSGDFDIFCGGEVNVRRYRRMAVRGDVKCGFDNAKCLTDEFCQYGKRIDPGIENTEPPAVKNPSLAGVPLADILFPVDPYRCRFAVTKPRLRGGNGSFPGRVDAETSSA